MLAKEKISVLCPTRARPKNTRRLLSSIAGTVSAIESVEVVFYLDDDDTSGIEGISACVNDFPGLSIKVLVGKKVVLSEMWNICQRNASGSIFMVCGDDIAFRTSGWDEIVRKKFEDIPQKIGYVHGDDGYFKDKFGTHGFLHKNWVDAVGYFVPPYFSSDYCDSWLNEVANIIGRRYFVPILTEHLHPNFGKAEVDNTYAERFVNHRKDNVSELYKQKAPDRITDSLKLRIFILEEKIGVRPLLNWHPKKLEMPSS